MSLEVTGDADAGDGFSRPMELTDPQVMRALSHPVRLALIELLSLESKPLTATEAGERIGESSTTCSFHLRQLAKYGFVEEAGGGRGRARPWQARNLGFSIDSEALSPSEDAAAEALFGAALTRQLARHAAARRARRGYPDEWRSLVTQGEAMWWVTVEEADELRAELVQLMQRYVHRRDPAHRPPGAKAVEFVALLHPFDPPPVGNDVVDRR